MSRQLLGSVLILTYCLSVIGGGGNVAVSLGCRCSEKEQNEKTCCCSQSRPGGKSCCSSTTSERSGCCGNKRDNKSSQPDNDSKKGSIPKLNICGCGGASTYFQSLDDPRVVADIVQPQSRDTSSSVEITEVPEKQFLSLPETPPPKI